MPFTGQQTHDILTTLLFDWISFKDGYEIFYGSHKKLLLFKYTMFSMFLLAYHIQESFKCLTEGLKNLHVTQYI
jgi:hypothetical protein